MLIARDIERRRLQDAYDSEKSEFVAVYGRRRVGKTFLIKEVFNRYPLNRPSLPVGKTFLIKEVFNSKFTFLHTGIADAPVEVQLNNFSSSLTKAGSKKIFKFSPNNLDFKKNLIIFATEII